MCTQQTHENVKQFISVTRLESVGQTMNRAFFLAICTLAGLAIGVLLSYSSGFISFTPGKSPAVANDAVRPTTAETLTDSAPRQLTVSSNGSSKGTPATESNASGLSSATAEPSARPEAQASTHNRGNTNDQADISSLNGTHELLPGNHESRSIGGQCLR